MKIIFWSCYINCFKYNTAFPKECYVVGCVPMRLTHVPPECRRTIECQIPENSTHHSHQSENLKSKIPFLVTEHSLSFILFYYEWYGR